MALTHGDRPDQTIYRPILNGRRGELEALDHLDPSLASLVTPVLLLTAPTRGAASDPSRPVDPLDRLPAGLTVAVELTDPPCGGPAVNPDPDGLRLFAGIRRPVIPVLRVGATDQRLSALGAVARAGLGRAVVRLRPIEEAPGSAAAHAAVRRVWHLAGVSPEQCDLVIDLADIGCRADVRTAAELARRFVGWARRESWRSLTVAAGSMPSSLSALPMDEPVRLPRWESALWREVADLGIAYGDYGIVSPTPEPAGPRRPLPTLRYTAEDAWWIYRWSRRGGNRGDERFRDLCRVLVRADHWPPGGAGFSWGDHEIARRSRITCGPGSASSWVAWGTSHHLAQVLAGIGRPTTPDPVRLSAADRPHGPGRRQRPGSWPAHRRAPGPTPMR